MAEQLELFEDNPEYESFVEKFEPKKTTDDCYTEELVNRKPTRQIDGQINMFEMEG